MINLNTQYLSKYPDDLDPNLPNPYSKKHLEASPLNRVLEQAAPGADWAIDNGHTIKFHYQTNTNTDKVRLFKVNFPTGNTQAPQLVSQGIYQPGQLYKTITKDENWQPNQRYPNEHTTEEYKNKQGQVILKRTYNQKKWHDTYYVYDDYGNLSYVLPPKTDTYANFWQTEASSQYRHVNSNDLCQKVLAAPNSSYGSLSFNSYSKTIQFSASAYTYGGNTSYMDITFKVGKVLDLNLGVNLDGLVLTGTLSANHQDSTISRSVSATIRGNELHLNSGFGRIQGGYYSFNLNASLDDIDITILEEIPSTDLNSLAYQYKYDYRNRLIEKKIPGKDWEYIVYDKLDRPILTQDISLRNDDQWLFTKYDVFGRVAYTGIYTHGSSLSQQQMQAHSDTAPAQTGAAKLYYEQRTSSEEGSSYVHKHYTNYQFPYQNIEILTVNYYDNYNFNRAGTTTSITAYGIASTDKTKTLVTGSKVKVLDTNKWITTVSYYDDRARPIYTYSKNDYLETTDIVESKLDFVGKVLETKSTHKKTGQTAIVSVDSFTYDHTARLLTQTQELNPSTDSASTELIVNNHYDELGQLTSKNVGGDVAAIVKNSQGLQTIDYSYNIRGWLKTINDPKHLNNSNDLFSFGLNYNKPNGPSIWHNRPLYNGNISHAYWKSNNVNNSLKHYSYRYDALNRFTHSYYAENDRYNNKYNTYVYNYDRNGNIGRLFRSTENPRISRYSAKFGHSIPPKAVQTEPLISD